MANPKAITKSAKSIAKDSNVILPVELDRLRRAEQDLARITSHATETLCRLIDNDQATLEYYTHKADLAIQRAPSCPQVKDYTWTIEQAERYNLAEMIKVTIENITDGGPESRLFGALLGQCFVSIGIGLVNWDDVADHYLTKYRESQT